MKRRCSPLLALALVACATAPPPPSQSANDPSNPRAGETPFSRIAAMPTSSGDAGASGPTIYACPMHPDVTATEPGHHCPKCGMELVPRRNAP